MLSYFDLVPTNAAAVRVHQRYGRLTVLAVGQKPNTYRYYAICRCECGSPPKKVRFDSLLDGGVVSCGCYQLERSTTHGLHSSPHYKRWINMLLRCNDPDNQAYENYGGRGIKVCKDWHTLERFVEQLPDGYFVGAEMDRIDNDGHYEPGNVRWVTRQVNTTNRRTRVNLTLGDKTQSISEWSKETGISVSVIWSRLNEHKWSVERTLTTPPMDKYERMKEAHKKRWEGHEKKPASPKRVFRSVEFHGSQVTLQQLAALTGIDRKLLAKRIFERGWTVERATAKV